MATDAVARAENTLRGVVDSLPMSAKQELHRRVKWMFEKRSTITIREFKTLIRALGAGLNGQEATGVFAKYAQNGGLLKMYEVVRALFGDTPAKQSWAEMTGCRLPGIATPATLAPTASARQSSNRGNAQALLEAQKAIRKWTKRDGHTTLWSAYQAFKAMAPGSIPGNDRMSCDMFVAAMRLADPAFNAHTAAAAFHQSDLNRDGNLDVNEFKTLVPALNDRTPIWVTRKGIRLGDPNPGPPPKLAQTLPKPSKLDPIDQKTQGWPWVSPTLDTLYEQHQRKYVRPAPAASCLFHNRPGSHGDQMASPAAEFAHEWHWRQANASRRETWALIGAGMKGEYRDYMTAKYNLPQR